MFPHGEFIYSGIDRLDSSKGYSENNIVACCWRCNFAKLDSEIEEFKSWIENTYNNLHKKEDEYILGLLSL